MKWFKRFAEVPQIGYRGPSIDRTKLIGHDFVPNIEIYNWEGKRHESMSWPLPNGSTTASPAANWRTEPHDGETSPRTALRELFEVLELPGTMSDYHFAIQGCCNQLWDWKTRRTEPWVYSNIEKLCWLDIRLIETYPDTVKSDQKEGPAYYGINAFHILLYIYKQEGYLHEALDVARRAVRFEQHQKDFEELEQLITQLEAENEQ